jgi:hypothetical protein
MPQKLWQCPKCKREFQKKNQSHSCKSFPIENHFKGKDYAQELFEYLKSQIEKTSGPLKIESLPCCIHFVSNYTFGACWALKDRIRIDFRLDYKIDDPRIQRFIQMSANRYLYYFDLKDKKDVDGKLLGWIKEAYELNEKGK